MLHGKLEMSNKHKKKFTVIVNYKNINVLFTFLYFINILK